MDEDLDQPMSQEAIADDGGARARAVHGLRDPGAVYHRSAGVGCASAPELDDNSVAIDT